MCVTRRSHDSDRDHYKKGQRVYEKHHMYDFTGGLLRAKMGGKILARAPKKGPKTKERSDIFLRGLFHDEVRSYVTGSEERIVNDYFILEKNRFELQKLHCLRYILAS